MTIYDYRGNPVIPYWTENIRKHVPEWQRKYKQVDHEEVYRYSINLRADSAWHEVIGRVERRADGRYEWYIKQSSFYKQWGYYKHGAAKPAKLQGVASSLEEAKHIIEGNWNGV